MHPPYLGKYMSLLGVPIQGMGTTHELNHLNSVTSDKNPAHNTISGLVLASAIALSSSLIVNSVFSASPAAEISHTEQKSKQNGASNTLNDKNRSAATTDSTTGNETHSGENLKALPMKHFGTVSAALSEYGNTVRSKLKPAFNKLNVSYPPLEQKWVCLKEEKMLFIFALDRKGKMKRVLSYPIIGASGVAGPKLKEGDKQVPEGFYKFDGFRPNVIAHLGLSVNYPNAEDKAHAKAEKRSNLGKDILIHGSRWSTGCLAMGNEPIEEMFVLTHDSGLDAVKLVFAPCDLTRKEAQVDYKLQPEWLSPLYKRLKDELMPLSNQLN